EAVVGVEDIVFKNDEAVLITNSCLLEFQDNLLEKYLKQYNCLSLPPLTYRDGTLFARVIALSEQQLTKVYHDLNDEHPVQVDAKREIESIAPDVPLLMLDSALPNLSNRQREALRTAIEGGYYEIPRETTTEEMATELGISRRTFEEHLRRAENQIVKNLREYLLV
ncbi:MAG: helix-turn-helix domain-containing protein, partial [Halobacteriaceae archaeon]